jgi:hypothetical protein
MRQVKRRKNMAAMVRRRRHSPSLTLRIFPKRFFGCKRLIEKSVVTCGLDESYDNILKISFKFFA